MKKITIFQENAENIVLFDDDSTDLLTYTKKINEVLESTKVCILQTSSQVVSVKPSKLNSIVVEEVEEKKSKSKTVDEKKIVIIKEAVDPDKKPVNIIDIIKD